MVKKVSLGEGAIYPCNDQDDDAIGLVSEEKVYLECDPSTDDEIVVSDEPATDDGKAAYAAVRTSYFLSRGDLEHLLQVLPNESAIKDMADYWDGHSYGNLSIIVDDGEDDNAFYARNPKRALHFFHFTGKDGKVIRTCWASDVIVHETGHSILDILKPEFFNGESFTGGFHEHFADLNAIFWALSRLSEVEDVIIETKGDLRKPNFIAELAEQLGDEIESSPLRNANDDLTLGNVNNEVHDLSRVMTSAVWSSFIDLFEQTHSKNQAVSPADHSLFLCAQYFRRFILLSVILYNKDSFEDLDDIKNMYMNGANKLGNSYLADRLGFHFTHAESHNFLFKLGKLYHFVRRTLGSK